MVDYGYDDLEHWTEFLIELETRMLTLVGNTPMIELICLTKKDQI